MKTFYFVDEKSGERRRKLTPDEARSIVAVKMKKREASPEGRATLSR